MTAAHVWYFAYGSNLLMERMLLYLRGGRGASGHMHAGSPDRTPMKAAFAHEMPLTMQLGFSGPSERWENGGVAQLNPSSESAEIKGRRYLITRTQFQHVFAQENDLSLDARGAVFRERDYELLAQGRTLEKEGRYDLVVPLGTIDSHLVVTLASSRAPHRVPPGPKYLQTVVWGLLETYPQLSLDAVVAYLGSAGVTDARKVRELVTTPVVRHRTGCFSVLPTELRREARGGYIVQMTPRDMKRLDLSYGERATLRRYHPALGRTADENFIRLECRVERPESDTDDGVLRVDQTLRTALGAAPGTWLRVEGAPVGSGPPPLAFPTPFAAHTEQVMRVVKSRPEDMEKPHCRISMESAEILGIKSGDSIRLDSGRRKLVLRALVLSGEHLRAREVQTAEDKGLQVTTSGELDDVTFASPSKRMELAELSQDGQDLPWIFMSSDQRQELGVQPLDPVYVRRDLSHVLLKRTYLVSLPIMIGLVYTVLVDPSAHWEFLLGGLAVVLVLEFLAITKNISGPAG